MRNDLPTIAPDQVKTLKAAVLAAALSPAGADLDHAGKSRRCNALYGQLFRRYGIDRPQDMPAVALGDALRWLEEQSRPNSHAGLEERARAALERLRAARAGLYQYQQAVKEMRAVAGELLPLAYDRMGLSGNARAFVADGLSGAIMGQIWDVERSLVETGDRAEASALGLLRLARGLDQQEVRE